MEIMKYCHIYNWKIYQGHSGKDKRVESYLFLVAANNFLVFDTEIELALDLCLKGLCHEFRID